jgi:ectoine hydroxylase-related dioxygenase (phytanoyl-CoA dioxygenase family)
MGPTELVPRSHRSGRAPEPRAVEPSYDGNKPVPILAKAGDCLLYDSQIWHRGSPHRGGADRYAVKVVYGRRFMAQRFYPNVGRQVPERILDGLSPRRKRLLGFHETMEYGPE